MLVWMSPSTAWAAPLVTLKLLPSGALTVASVLYMHSSPALLTLLLYELWQVVRMAADEIPAHCNGKGSAVLRGPNV